MNRKIVIIIAILIVLIIVILIMKNIPDREKETKEVVSKVEDNIDTTENIELAEYIENQENNTLKNTSKKLKENKTIDDLQISNIRITGEEKETTIMMDIQNNSKQTKGNKEVTLIMKDQNEKEIGKIGIQLSEIKPNEAITLELKTELNFINTYDFSIIDEALSF